MRSTALDGRHIVGPFEPSYGVSMLTYIVVGAFFLFQGWVTWRVWRDEFFIRSEKIAQTKLIWFTPLLGAVMVYSMLIDEAKHHR